MRASGAFSGCATGEMISPSQVESVKMGTTVATNALLERRGEPTVLVTTRGFRDALRIATQARPRLFARHIVLPERLYESVIEADERVDARGGVITALDTNGLERALAHARRAGLTACAIVLLHSYRAPAHELEARGAWRGASGFTQISVSHRVSPTDEAGPARRHHRRGCLSLAHTAPLCRARGRADAGRALAVHAKLGRPHGGGRLSRKGCDLVRPGGRHRRHGRMRARGGT